MPAVVPLAVSIFEAETRTYTHASRRLFPPLQHWVLWSGTPSPIRHTQIRTGLAVASTLPLYFVATDWGRWLTVSYTSSALLLLQANFASVLRLRARPPLSLVLALMIAALLITPDHTIGWKPGGAVQNVIQTAGDFL